MTRAEWAEAVEWVITYRRSEEHARRAYALVQKLQEAGW